MHESGLLCHVVSCDYVSLCLSFGRCVDLSLYICVCVCMCAVHVCLHMCASVWLPTYFTPHCCQTHVLFHCVAGIIMLRTSYLVSIPFFSREKKKIYMMVARMRAIARASLFLSARMPVCIGNRD